MWNFWRKHNWNNRKIAFVSILIATSVAFILIFNWIVPITTIPSFKIMAGGLPIKLTGYIFGPLIGAFTGFIADLLSFLMNPAFFHYWYSFAFASAGLIPGVVGYLMHRRWKNKNGPSQEDQVKYNNVNFIATLIILSAVITGVTTFIFLQDQSVFDSQKLIKNKFIFATIAIAGNSTMLIGVIIFRFVLKPKTFNSLLPIIVFSSILEIVDTPLIALGDQSVFFGDGDHSKFLVLLTAHFLMSPVKIWGNMLIIAFAYKIVAPLIYNKTGNGWENKTSETDLKGKGKK